MESHFDLSDKQFEVEFETLKFNPKLLTHEAHIRLAYIHLDNYGLDIALENFCKQFMNFVTHHKAEGKFNMTLTVAAIYAIHHFKIQSKSDDFRGFIAEFPQLKTDFKSLINTHYSFDIYNSEKAKRVYLEPDLIPFN